MTAAWLAEELFPAADRDAAPGTPLRLAASRCSVCDRCSFPATGTCTWCGATGSEPEPLSSGTAVAATAVLHRTPGAVVQVPYVVALVRFARAGLDVLGRVTGAADPAAVPPGMSLRVVAESLPDGRMHYAFAAPSDQNGH
jgi:uncharacterized OB-fold protein